MSYQINNEWFQRTGSLTLTELLLASERYSEFKYYEGQLPEHPEVLDVGVGLGFETAYYLNKGATVDALDTDVRILDALAERCRPYQDWLRTIHLDVPFQRRPDTKKGYDLIIISNVLHYLTYAEISICLRQLSGLLKKDGFILLRAHSKKHPYNDPNHPKYDHYKYFFSLGDIRGFFPPDSFKLMLSSEYYRAYNDQECLLFGYDPPGEYYKYGITAILKHMK